MGYGSNADFLNQEVCFHSGCLADIVNGPAKYRAVMAETIFLLLTAPANNTREIIMATKSSNDLWEAIGSLAEDETVHVITKLFSMYEEMLQKNSDDSHARLFFRNLDTAITQSTLCNLNRR